ncbi:MAG: hypothetical protein EXS51_00435 [Candidatus Taylorbacteria bacterium]|nr:hypothetical protein [Candidatus Taylorbacteria bacterium]
MPHTRKPKICFFLQRSYAFTGHALAELLKEKYGVEEFCAYTGLRKVHDALKRKHTVSYSTLLLDEDVHNRYTDEKLDLQYLTWLEKEYGIPNVWPYLCLDREIMSNQAKREYPYNTPRYTHEEMLRILQVTAKAVISFLDTEKPDAVIFSTVGNVPGYLLYEIAKKRGIKVLYILTAPIRERIVVSETYDSFSDTNTLFKERLASGKKDTYYEEAKKVLEDFRNAPVPYDPRRTPEAQQVNRRKQLRFLAPKNFLRSISWFVRLTYEYAFGTTRNDYTSVNPFHYALDHIRRKARNLCGASDLYDAFIPEEPYAYFALTYEPEISLLLLAPFAQDQINCIRHAARSLPVGWKLYVKEHPEMAHFRPRSYYKELKKIPNVKFISPTIGGFTLLRHAQLVFTITGSAAWEGLVFKKPAIVFGNQFYNVLSMVKKCAEPETLPFLVKQQLEEFSHDEEELLCYTAALIEDSAFLPFIYLWEEEFDEEKKKRGLAPLADLLAKKLGLA